MINGFEQGTLTEGGRPRAVDLLIKGFVKLTFVIPKAASLN